MRLSEWIIVVYFAWATSLAVALPVPDASQTRALIANSIVFATCIVLPRLRQTELVQILRDWIPQLFLILGYKEMGWFATESHTNRLEQSWIVWDRLLLDHWHLRAAIESMGPVLPALLELSYLVVYIVPPVTMLILYLLKLRARSDTMLSIYLLAMFLCYAQFPFWPSEPPRVVFAGQDLPSIGSPVRTFNLWIVGNYGIHTSVFPSAHVAGAVAAALGFAYLARRRRLLVAGYAVYAALVSVATVYGRYHYAVDATAGLALGFLAFLAVIWHLRRLTPNRQP